MTAKTRAELRAAIFASENTKPKTKIIDFFNQKVEVRQPSMDTILNFRSAAEEDRKASMVGMLIAYVYVPGTEETLFEEADREQLLSMPFGSDFTLLQKTISELTDVDLQVKEAAKN